MNSARGGNSLAGELLANNSQIGLQVISLLKMIDHPVAKCAAKCIIELRSEFNRLNEQVNDLQCEIDFQNDHIEWLEDRINSIMEEYQI
jgi:hypothetical protein